MMVDPLAGKPDQQVFRDWLLDCSKTANMNQQLSTEWITFAGQPALRVHYRNADASETECTCTLFGAGARYKFRLT